MYELSNFPIEMAYMTKKVVLPDTIKSAVLNENWEKLDFEFNKLIQKDGYFFNELKYYFPKINEVEFIINIRDAKNDHEEDGIWHDDGSRIFAFTLGLNLEPQSIKGGKLKIRKKGEANEIVLSPPLFGECYFFKTGTFGYEHKIFQVIQGRRIVIAGWCT